MPAPIAIPLIAASPQIGAAIAAGGAAIGTYIAGQAFKRSYESGQISTPGILKPNSTPQQFTDASANYLKAYSEYETTRGKGFSSLQADKDVATEIAKNYDWVAVDEASGKLAILADRDLAAGGDLSVSVTGSNVTVSNDVVLKNIPFENYGTDQLPLAVTQETAFNIALSDDGTLPLIVEQEVALSNLQLVAQSAIEYEKINPVSDNQTTILSNQTTAELPNGIGQDLVDQTVPNSSLIDNVNLSEAIAAANQDLGLPPVQSFGEDVVNPAFSPEQVRITAGYLEDTPVVVAPDAITNASSFESARALEIAAANSLGTTPGVELPPPLARSNFNNATQSITNTRAVSQESPKTNTSAGSKPTPKERPNPLHDYVNWTYKISWYALSKDKANIISSGKLNPGGEGALTEGATPIMSSGGLKQHSNDFPYDMYFNSLTIESIVGVSGRSRGVDGISFDMEVVEPYNITLIPRLVQANNNLNGNKDWGLGFYLLKVEFIGYDDQGEPKIVPNTTKYFPFQMVNFTFKVGAKHTAYQIKGVPYHHMSQTALDNTIPFHMEIVGGTVEEIFNGSKATATGSGSRGGGARDSSIATTDGVTGGNSGGPLVKGVAIALNENEDFIKKAYPKKEKNNFSFEFKDDMGSSKVNDPETYQTSAFAMSNPKKLDKYLDKTKNTFRIQNGTKISDLINIVLQMSDYYVKQYKPKSSESDPILSHKIIPQVTYGKYDCVTKTWQRDVKFVVKKHVIYGNDTEGFGKKAPPGYSKSYKWLFTGQNKDVLNVDIDYKVAFFDVKNANEKIKVLSKDGSANVRDGDQANNEPCVIPELPARSILVSGIASQNNTGAKDRNIATLSLEELFHKQFDSAGDNISLNLQIIGDPDLLQQDNLLYSANTDGSQTFIPNSSVNFQDFEVYFNFEFKSPMKDYDDSTGLFQVNDATTNSFNGLYKIVKVKSEFRGGKFTQQIENYRVRTQSNSSGEARTSSSRSGFRQGGTDAVVENSTYTVNQNDSNPFDVAGGGFVTSEGDSNPFTVAGGTTTDAANAAQNSTRDLTQELINNNPGDPNVPTSSFG
jgi:hypothetical protein